jgi:hypothetical protein
MKKLTGWEAIEYAETYNLLLCKYNDPIEGARETLTINEAMDVARQDPDLIYLEIKHYMNLATGSIGDYGGWWYEKDGRLVNAVDLGEVVEVEFDAEKNTWVAA